MNIKKLIFYFCFVIPLIGQSQEYYQYFDGADTTEWESIFITIDTNASNIWQIGEPSKAIFNSASTVPNAIVTDTLNFYPSNNTSSFSFYLPDIAFGWGILAIQWTQKLDLESGVDGGLIEFSNDSGLTWSSAFNNPFVYNFYGFEEENLDTLPNNDFAFSGMDSTWRDIWLCFDVSWLDWGDNLSIRYTLKSDSTDSNNEGWMMDNFMVHLTYIHTVNEIEQEEYMTINPNPTTGRIDINTKKNSEYHIIESIQLVNSNGEIVKEYGTSPTKFNIDISDQANGIYFLRVNTNLKSEIFKVVLQK